jgi:hypothetical protein
MVIKTKDFSGITSNPLSVAQIQNIIIAKPIFDLKNYQIKTNTLDQLNIQNQDLKLGIGHYYKPSTLTIDSTFMTNKTNVKQWAKIRYSEYALINDHVFPIKAQIESQDEQRKNIVQLNYTDVDFISPLTFPFTIPSSYVKAK